jgi:hypothetical protein
MNHGQVSECSTDIVAQLCQLTRGCVESVIKFNVDLLIHLMPILSIWRSVTASLTVV